jgi:hypothetical protein
LPSSPAQPKLHIHLAVHRRCHGEALAGLLELARAPVELPQTEATVGNERPHAPGLAERQGAALGVEPVGMGCDLTEQTQRMGGDATGACDRAFSQTPRLVQPPE